jgi:hypothetical protein
MDPEVLVRQDGCPVATAKISTAALLPLKGTARRALRRGCG